MSLKLAPLSLVTALTLCLSAPVALAKGDSGKSDIERPGSDNQSTQNRLTKRMADPKVTKNEDSEENEPGDTEPDDQNNASTDDHPTDTRKETGSNPSDSSSNGTSAHTGGGKTKRDKSSTTKVALKADLTDAVGSHLGRIQLVEGKKGSGLLAQIAVALPNVELGWDNQATVTASTMTVTFSDADGMDYASCDFDMTNFRLNKKRNVGAAKFSLMVSDKNGVISEISGACDTDLETANYEAGIPAIQSGDQALLSIDTADIAVGQGTFQ